MKGGMCDGNGTCNLGGVVHVTLPTTEASATCASRMSPNANFPLQLRCQNEVEKRLRLKAQVWLRRRVLD
jgi:hypothetical protein